MINGAEGAGIVTGLGAKVRGIREVIGSLIGHRRSGLMPLMPSVQLSGLFTTR